MRASPILFAASAAVAVSFSVAFAQDNSTQGHDMASMELPKACQKAKAPQMPGMENMQSMMQGMKDHQKEAMQGMMQTHVPMMQGMMAEDADVSFACGMIPHHMAAISMAKVELKYGDSDEMKEMAQKIIEAQQAEIQELTQWIEAEASK